MVFAETKGSHVFNERTWLQAWSNASLRTTDFEYLQARYLQIRQKRVKVKEGGWITRVTADEGITASHKGGKSVEHFKSPFGPGDFVSANAIENQRFFEHMLERSKHHRFYSHPFMTALKDVTPSRDVVSFILTSFYKIVSPFTGVLCSLSGRAPDLRTRFALMDNVYEEMGCGDLSAAHPSLYLRMLSSISITPNAAESTRTLAAIRRINEHLIEVVERQPFSVACAVLASAEATIPPSFPVLATIARRAFPEADMRFFERHGVRDEGHSGDAAMLFAVTASSSEFAIVDEEVSRDLDFRAELFDEWMVAVKMGVPSHSSVSARPPRRFVSERPSRILSERPSRIPPSSVRPGANRPSVPPPSVG